MLPRRSLERRLFAWLLACALGPALFVLAGTLWLWSGWLEWVGTLGPWGRVAESGRALLEAARHAAGQDPALAAALARHREELSNSLLLARRWAFLGDRLAAALPLLAAALAAALAALALLVARRLARGLARPFLELVGWTERLAREEELPPPGPDEARELPEVRALRDAFRRAQAELAAARRRALEAERIRLWGEMARRVAHEMKNPLTPLRLAAHRLARARGEEVWRECIGVIEEETARLEELAAGFAALGRPPAGPRSAVDLRELLAALLATDVPPGIAARLDCAPDLPPLDAHYDSLLRAFRNLVRNAVEAVSAGPAAGPPAVEVTVRRAAGGAAGTEWLEVRVADNGPGLPEGAGERIFEPDFTTKSRGTGLGLALVRQAVAWHGGEVRARNRPEGGAEFLVRLPAGAPAPAEVGA